MKKIILLSIALSSLLLMSQNIQAQAFQKGNINFDVGLGIGAYGTKVTFKAAGLEFSETDGASSFVVPISFEYGVTDKVGIGAQFGSSSYFIDQDSSDATESVKALDFGVNFNFHLLSSDKNDLFIGLGFGASSVKWAFKNINETYSGTGNYFNLYITDRIFFSDNIGVLFNLGYKGYTYNNMESSTNNAFLDGLTWSLKGVNFGTGLAVKF
jgi:hypothetical protein